MFHMNIGKVLQLHQTILETGTPVGNIITSYEEIYKSTFL
uniref:Uncharacterized protein n=1 Tax=Anguilla anguilla TaxID=7936 RepID=A0A0E9P792_ANGAN